MKTISLTRGAAALVDDKDYKTLSFYKWTLKHNGYAYRVETKGTTYTGSVSRFGTPIVKEKGKTLGVFMHHQIIGRKPGFEVDHINGRRFDNRRSNLRFVTRKENRKNFHPGLFNSYFEIFR